MSLVKSVQFSAPSSSTSVAIVLYSRNRQPIFQVVTSLWRSAPRKTSVNPAGRDDVGFPANAKFATFRAVFQHLLKLGARLCRTRGGGQNGRMDHPAHPVRQVFFTIPRPRKTGS